MALTVAAGTDRLVAPADGAVSTTFHGVTVQLPPDASEVARLDRADVGVVRFLISWEATEPSPGVYDWSQVDAYVRAIEASGAEPLPFFGAAPGWLPAQRHESPLNAAAAETAWGDFVAEATRRYGPGGSAGLAKPIRTWQLWNEPNLDQQWDGQADPRAYARFAAAGAASIRSVDPGAKIVLAGLAPAARDIKPWTFMRRLLRDLDPGVFDSAAIHPYGRTVADVETQIARVRRQMRLGGAGNKPLAVTEVGWSSSRLAVPTLAGTQRSQARKLTEVYRALARHKAWRISQVLWYSLRDIPSEPENCGFCTSSGLLRTGGAPKPAWVAFKRSMGDLR